MFLLCALLPTIALALIAYRQVASQLDQQSRERLRAGSKLLGMTLIERLQLYEAELGRVTRESSPTGPLPAGSLESAATHFAGLVLTRKGVPDPKVQVGPAIPIPPLQREQMAHLALGRTQLLVGNRGGDEPLLLMARALNPDRPEQSVLWGELRLSDLMTGMQDDASQLRVDLLADGHRLGVATPAEPEAVSPPELQTVRGHGDFEWSVDGTAYLAGSWTVFLKQRWNTASWTVVVSEPRARVLAPMSNFRRTFALVVCIVLVLVFLLSNIQIRRGMRPLVELQRGTLRVAAGEFTHRVHVRTGDEFEVLANSFNSMAGDLGGQFTALTAANQRLEHLSWGTLAALARTIDASSPWTAGHSERVTRLSLAIGQHLSLSPADLDRLHRGGLLHDIGKIGVPHELLDYPGKLTDEQMAIIRSHPDIGARILAPLSVFSDIIPIVRYHHEKLDGTGYPDRLAGNDIPYLARIVAVADVYDALVSDRPYRPGWTPEAALDLIQKTSGAHHEPALVDALVDIWRNGGLASLPEVSVAVGETGELLELVGGGVG